MAAACYKKQQAFLADSQVIYNIWVFLSIIYNETVNTAFKLSLAKPKIYIIAATCLCKPARPHMFLSICINLFWNETAFSKL